MQNFYPEPIWCTPQEADLDCSSLIATGPTPMVLTGAFIRLIQYHFSDPNNIQNPHFKGYIWTNSPKGCISNVDYDTDPGSSGSSSGSEEPPCPEPDTSVEGSRILITASYKRDGVNIQQRPAILIKREAVKTSRINLENKALSGVNKDGVLSGAEHQVTISGKHSIIAVGQSGAEADALAEEIYFRMLQYMPVIRADLRLGHFLPDVMSEVRDIKEESSLAFYSVISLAWAYVYRWRVIAESPILKRTALTYKDYN